MHIYNNFQIVIYHFIGTNIWQKGIYSYIFIYYGHAVIPVQFTNFHSTNRSIDPLRQQIKAESRKTLGENLLSRLQLVHLGIAAATRNAPATPSGITTASPSSPLLMMPNDTCTGLLSLASPTVRAPPATGQSQACTACRRHRRSQPCTSRRSSLQGRCPCRQRR